MPSIPSFQALVTYKSKIMSLLKGYEYLWDSGPSQFQFASAVRGSFPAGYVDVNGTFSKTKPKGSSSHVNEIPWGPGETYTTDEKAADIRKLQIGKAKAIAIDRQSQDNEAAETQDGADNSGWDGRENSRWRHGGDSNQKPWWKQDEASGGAVGAAKVGTAADGYRNASSTETNRANKLDTKMKNLYDIMKKAWKTKADLKVSKGDQESEERKDYIDNLIDDEDEKIKDAIAEGKEAHKELIEITDGDGVDYADIGTLLPLKTTHVTTQDDSYFA